MRERGTTALAAALLALLALSCQATPPADAPVLTVIHDSGRSIPLAPYLSSLMPDAEQPGAPPGVSFPIRTWLRAGVLTQDEVQAFDPRWLVQPVFIVGTDRASFLWIEHNRDRLLAMGAWGVVIAAPDVQAFKALQRAAAGLELAPSQGPWLERRLAQAGVDAYPVLIGTDGRVRQIARSESLAPQSRP